MTDYEGARCAKGHELEIVSEGYGLCYMAFDDDRGLWSAWAFSAPAATNFHRFPIIGRDGKLIDAWVTNMWCFSKEEALSVIQADIDAHRARPFDEERERARLMPV